MAQKFAGLSTTWWLVIGLVVALVLWEMYEANPAAVLTVGAQPNIASIGPAAQKAGVIPTTLEATY